MASNTLSRREAIKRILGLPLALSLGNSISNAQTPSENPEVSTLEHLTQENHNIKKSVFDSVEKIRKATLSTETRLYVPNPEVQGQYYPGVGVLLKPKGSERTFFASCYHIWNPRASNNGLPIRTLLDYAKKSGFSNFNSSDVIILNALAGHSIKGLESVGSSVAQDYSIIDVTSLARENKLPGEPLQLDTNREVSHQKGDKVYWLSGNTNGFPLLESNIIDPNCITPPDQEIDNGEIRHRIKTDRTTYSEIRNPASGKPVFNFYNGKPIFTGIITGTASDPNHIPARAAFFTSANNIAKAIRDYELTH